VWFSVVGLIGEVCNTELRAGLGEDYFSSNLAGVYEEKAPDRD
jgi:hypothetical protein